MIPADAQPATWIQLIAIIATGLVGAWTTVRIAQIDRAAKKHRRRSAVERTRCDGLEARVKELETALAACLRRRKRR